MTTDNAAPGAEVATQAGTGRYLYAVCRGLDPQALGDARGLDDAPLELVAHADLVAVVSTVPLASYGEEALRRNLEDLAWLETVVRRHDDVVHAAARHAPTAPMRLATICFDDDAVRARLREWHVDLTHVLDRVEGCAEWSVKVLAPPAAAPAPTDDAPVSGADYLRRRKAAVEQRADADASAARAAEAVDEELNQLARASRRLPAQDPRLSGLQGSMVLNAAYLVAHEDSAAFEDRIHALATNHSGVVVDARGPWPPYSFAMLEQR
jgi:hypothetical protein